MGKDDTRAKLLEAGEAAFLQKGFHNTGIQEILKAAGVPKGSFYYYFKSKEDFGIEVVKAYASSYEEKIDPMLADCGRPPLARLRSVFEFLIDDLVDRGLRHGCLVGNLSQEMADQSDAFRVCLDEIVAGWHRDFTTCLEEAQANGQLDTKLDAAKFANFCLDSWEGAVLRAKLSKSPDPLEDFVSIMFEVLLVEDAGEIAAVAGSR